jgi:hypothetical protein
MHVAAGLFKFKFEGKQKDSEAKSSNNDETAKDSHDECLPESQE